MKKFFKIILIVLSLVFVVIQLVPSGRPGNQLVDGQDIFEINDIPPDIGLLLKNACYDCHSQAVKYPWYSYVAPVSWLVVRDVKMGREHLDFGKWGELTKRKQIKVLTEIAEEVEEGNMPMPIYINMHSEADLTDEQRKLVISWSEQLAEKIFDE